MQVTLIVLIVAVFAAVAILAKIRREGSAKEWKSALGVVLAIVLYAAFSLLRDRR